MKKNWLCLLMLAVLVCLLPVGAMAEAGELNLETLYEVWAEKESKGEDVPIFHVFVQEHIGTMEDIKVITGTVPIEDEGLVGELEDYGWIEIEISGDKTITLRNLQSPLALSFEKVTDDARITLKLEGTNKIKNKYVEENGVLHSEPPLVITGGDDDRLTIHAEIMGNDANGEEYAAGVAIKGESSITINGGIIDVYGNNAGIGGFGEIQMNSGTLHAKGDTAAVLTLNLFAQEPSELILPLQLGTPAFSSGKLFKGWKVTADGATATMQPGDEVVTVEGADFTTGELINPVKELRIEPIMEVPSSASVPRTGDSANLALWGALLAVSAIGFITLGRKDRKSM